LIFATVCAFHGPSNYRPVVVVVRIKCQKSSASWQHLLSTECSFSSKPAVQFCQDAGAWAPVCLVKDDTCSFPRYKIKKTKINAYQSTNLDFFIVA